MKRLALPLIAVGILAACGGGDDAAPPAAATQSSAGEPATDTAPTAPPTPTTAPTATAASVPGTEAPRVPADVPEALRFAAPLVGGGDIELTTLAGRPVLLWFWAPW